MTREQNSNSSSQRLVAPAVGNDANDGMRILITGSTGQLGTELRRCLSSMTAESSLVPRAYENAKVDYTTSSLLDISDQIEIANWFETHGPYDLVINCAALTNVNGCESDETRALKVNALGPMHIAKACAEHHSTFVQISTDYVFSGSSQNTYTESDPPCPLSAYGRTKLAGELLAREANPQTHVIRTAWLYGYHGRNFVKTMLDLARTHGKVSVVSDQIGCPTHANDLALSILRIALTDHYGIWHCAGVGACSWFELARTAIELADIPCQFEELSSEEYRRRFPSSAVRPTNSRLVNAQLQATIGDTMRHWRDALMAFLENADVRKDAI